MVLRVVVVWGVVVDCPTPGVGAPFFVHRFDTQCVPAGQAEQVVPLLYGLSPTSLLLKCLPHIYFGVRSSTLVEWNAYTVVVRHLRRLVCANH